MSFRNFIKTPDFKKAIVRILLIYVGLSIFIWLFLNWYTDHGDFVSVPDLKGMRMEEAAQALEDRDLEYLVIDSIYDKKATPGTIMEQSPAPESQVKEGRQIFLTIHSYHAPTEKLGVREGDFATVAFIKLKNKGIEFDTLYEANNTFPGSIIRVTYKGRKTSPDDLISKGDKVVLVIGRAVRTKIIVPNFRGMTCAEAESMMDSLNLVCNCRFENIDITPTAQDSATFHVCRQDPVHDPSIGTSPGRIVDLWLYNTPCPQDTTHND